MDFNPESSYTTLDDQSNFSEDSADGYIVTEINLPTANEVSCETVRTRLKDKDGNQIGKNLKPNAQHKNVHCSEHHDDTLQEIQGNIICKNMILNIKNEGQHYLLTDKIQDHDRMQNVIPQSERCIYSKNSNRHRKKTTIGWKLLIWWKDGLTDWKHL